MKTIIARLIFIFSTIAVLSCGQTDNTKQVALKEKELQLKEKELELMERERRISEQSNPNLPSPQVEYVPRHVELNTEETPVIRSKYCYVYIETDEPEEKYNFGDIYGNGKGMYAESKHYNYKSSVIEVKNFTEDEKYKLIDKFEQQVRDQYEIKNMLLAKLNAECKILSSECFSFDTYKAASEHRRDK